MMAPMMTICGLPCSFNRSANALQIGLNRIADMAGKNKCLREWGQSLEMSIFSNECP